MFDMLPYAQLEVPDDAALDLAFTKTKGRMFFHKGAGFLGSLMCDHTFFWGHETDDQCETAWCNGEQIAWNRKFFYWLTPEERVTVLAHELWHTGYDHITRCGNRCPDLWNKAADYVINLRLKDDGFVFGEKLMSLKPCLDEQYRDMTTEEVYDKLVAEGGQPFQPDEGKPLQGDVRPGQGTMEEQAKAIVDKLVKARQASRMAGEEAGTVPGETTLRISEFLEPILPWEVLLQRFFTALSTNDYSWRRPSRRHQDDYLPSLTGENGLEHLIYYLDVSGSVSDADVLRFNSEVKHIHEELKPKLLTLVTFDRKIQDTFEFTDDMPFDKIEVHGRGGTSLVPVLDHIKASRPTAAVIFTDLRCKPMQEDPRIPLLWVVVGNKGAAGRFGQSVHINKESRTKRK